MNNIQSPRNNANTASNLADIRPRVSQVDNRPQPPMIYLSNSMSMPGPHAYDPNRGPFTFLTRRNNTAQFYRAANASRLLEKRIQEIKAKKTQQLNIHFDSIVKLLNAGFLDKNEAILRLEELDRIINKSTEEYDARHQLQAIDQLLKTEGKNEIEFAINKLYAIGLNPNNDYDIRIQAAVRLIGLYVSNLTTKKDCLRTAIDILKRSSEDNIKQGKNILNGFERIERLIERINTQLNTLGIDNQTDLSNHHNILSFLPEILKKVSTDILDKVIKNTEYSYEIRIEALQKIITLGVIRDDDRYQHIQNIINILDDNMPIRQKVNHIFELRNESLIDSPQTLDLLKIIGEKNNLSLSEKLEFCNCITTSNLKNLNDSNVTEFTIHFLVSITQKHPNLKEDLYYKIINKLATITKNERLDSVIDFLKIMSQRRSINLKKVINAFNEKNQQKKSEIELHILQALMEQEPPTDQNQINNVQRVKHAAAQRIIKIVSAESKLGRRALNISMQLNIDPNSSVGRYKTILEKSQVPVDHSLILREHSQTQLDTLDTTVTMTSSAYILAHPLQWEADFDQINARDFIDRVKQFLLNNKEHPEVCLNENEIDAMLDPFFTSAVLRGGLDAEEGCNEIGLKMKKIAWFILNYIKDNNISETMRIINRLCFSLDLACPGGRQQSIMDTYNKIINPDNLDSIAAQEPGEIIKTALHELRVNWVMEDRPSELPEDLYDRFSYYLLEQHRIDNTHDGLAITGIAGIELGLRAPNSSPDYDPTDNCRVTVIEQSISKEDILIAFAQAYRYGPLATFFKEVIDKAYNLDDKQELKTYTEDGNELNTTITVFKQKALEKLEAISLTEDNSPFYEIYKKDNDFSLTHPEYFQVSNDFIDEYETNNVTPSALTELGYIKILESLGLITIEDDNTESPE